MCRADEHENAADYNFDHPDALDFDLAYEKLCELLSGKDTEIPTYDFALHQRTKVTQPVKTAPIIIFEGIHSIYEKRFRDMMDLKIFVLTPDDIRLARRIERDIAERGRTVVDVLAQYCRFVKPAYDDFIKPTMKHADLIIPFSVRNDNAVDMLN
jgi:uridine kinase